MTIRREFLAAGIALPLLAMAGPQAGERPLSSRRVLLIGIDPELVDFTKLPQLNAQKLRAMLALEKARLASLGCSAQWCLIDTGPLAQRKVVKVLKAETFAVVSIGAGVRLPPENMLLFERVVNAVHHHAPQAKICFSNKANDTTEAVQRWLAVA